jgi:tetratricopeptide (TPR) repeat protein
MITSGREREAIEHLSAAVKYDPRYVEGRLRLAEVLRRSGRLEEALAQYEHVMMIDPRAAEARFGVAITTSPRNGLGCRSNRCPGTPLSSIRSNRSGAT